MMISEYKAGDFIKSVPLDVDYYYCFLFTQIHKILYPCTVLSLRGELSIEAGQDENNVTLSGSAVLKLGSKSIENGL